MDEYEDDAYADTPTPVAVTTGAADVPRATGYLDEYRKRGAAAGADFESIMKQRAEAVAQARGMLDKTIQEMREGRKGGMDPKMLALAAGFLKTTPGVVSNFSTELGNAFGNLAPVVARERMEDTDFLKGIASLQQKSAEMGDVPLKDAQAQAVRKQLAAEAGASKIEAAIIRAQAAGGPGRGSAKERLLAAWREIPGNENKTEAEYEAEMTLAKTRKVAEERMLDEYRKTKPNATLMDMRRDTAWTTAKAKEVGTEQGKAEQAIPALDATTEQMAGILRDLPNHPGFSGSVGLGSLVPSRPGSKNRDFEELLSQVQSQAFLIQYEKLRGAQAITDIEGEKATKALMSLSRGQSQPQFKKQLEVALDILKKGQEVLRKKAGAMPTDTSMPISDGTVIENDAGKKMIRRGGKWVDL